MLDDPALSRAPLLMAPSTAFTVPEWVDSRPYCLESSNQGQSPSCTGYAAAGYIEVMDWIRTGVQVQIDGDAIYAKEKELDGNNDPGSTLTQAVRAAQLLALLPSDKTIRTIYDRRSVQWALHKFRVCIAGCEITEDWQYTDPSTGYIGRKGGAKLGGHAILFCYYDKDGVGWQNSWKTTWGVRGFGRMTWEQFDEQFMHAVVLE